jgi:hypothetical protein
VWWPPISGIADTAEHQRRFPIVPSQRATLSRFLHLTEDIFGIAARQGRQRLAEPIIRPCEIGRVLRGCFGRCDQRFVRGDRDLALHRDGGDAGSQGHCRRYAQRNAKTHGVTLLAGFRPRGRCHRQVLFKSMDSGRRLGRIGAARSLLPVQCLLRGMELSPEVGYFGFNPRDQIPGFRRAVILVLRPGRFRLGGQLKAQFEGGMLLFLEHQSQMFQFGNTSGYFGRIRIGDAQSLARISETNLQFFLQFLGYLIVTGAIS